MLKGYEDASYTFMSRTVEKWEIKWQKNTARFFTSEGCQAILGNRHKSGNVIPLYWLLFNMNKQESRPCDCFSQVLVYFNIKTLGTLVVARVITPCDLWLVKYLIPVLTNGYIVSSFVLPLLLHDPNICSLGESRYLILGS